MFTLGIRQPAWLIRLGWNPAMTRAIHMVAAIGVGEAAVPAAIQELAVVPSTTAGLR